MATQGATRRGSTAKTIGCIKLWVLRVGNPSGHKERNHIENHWFYNAFGVQGWQPQVPASGGNTSRTIGFIRVWVSTVGKPSGHKVKNHIKNNLFYEALGVQGWQPQGSGGKGNTSKTIGFIMVWVSGVGSIMGKRVKETYQKQLVL